MNSLRHIFLSLLMLISLGMSAADYPCRGVVTASQLNVRNMPSAESKIDGKLQRGDTIRVLGDSGDEWLKAITPFSGYARFVSSRHVKLLPQTEADKEYRWEKPEKSWGSRLLDWGMMALYAGIGLTILLIAIVIVVRVMSLAFWTSVTLVEFLASLTAWTVKLVTMPFFILNVLQRILAKPWFLLHKRRRGTDKFNASLRTFYSMLKIPLYVVLAPVRLVNAVYFNIVTHCSFEMFNYMVEVFIPSDQKEGGETVWRWILMLPWRVVKYPLWHGALTIIESVLWTIADTLMPALTVYHGTSNDAADSIVASPGRTDYRGKRNIGMFLVGGGNYAGNGIYFAPARSTSEHYSSGSMIVCRVTFGRTLDLGLAPKHVYDACGHPDALVVTKWGLQNGYVTGEWWRGDPSAGWWEYCMYDWQNRYNISWRIRPLYVLDVDNGHIQRIQGGMGHWLFDASVMRDILTSLRKLNWKYLL